MEKVDVKLTEDQAKLYDRQIRLWGVDSQKRLNKSNILIIGLNGLGAEVSKNIILGGVKSVTLMDWVTVSEMDQASQFLATRDNIGKNRAEASLNSAQRLNPMVEVIADKSHPENKPDEFFKKFSVICATNLEKDQILRLNRIARLNKVNFFAADVFGFFSYIFIDLGEHSFRREVITPVTKENNATSTVKHEECFFIPFQDILNINWNSQEFFPKVKKTQPGLFALFVLLEFVEQEKRQPMPESRDEDYEKLLKIRDNFAKRNEISPDLIRDEYFSNVYGEISPICAINGGVLAQEIVKAISKKDEPIKNIYIYDYLSGTGFAESFA